MKVTAEGAQILIAFLLIGMVYMVAREIDREIDNRVTTKAPSCTPSDRGYVLAPIQ